MASKSGGGNGKKTVEKKSVSQKPESKVEALPVATTLPVTTKQALSKPNKEEHKMSEDNLILDLPVQLADVEAPEPLPDGKYPATIVKVERKVSKGPKGGEYASVTFLIDPKDFPVDFDMDGFEDGIQLTYNRVSLGNEGRMNKNVLFRLRKFVEAIGGSAGNRIDLSEWLHLHAVVELTSSEWEGVMRNEIKSVHSAE